MMSCGTSLPLTREARGRRPTTAERSRAKPPPVEISTVPSGGRVTGLVVDGKGFSQTPQFLRSGGLGWPCPQTAPAICGACEPCEAEGPDAALGGDPTGPEGAECEGIGAEDGTGCGALA